MRTGVAVRYKTTKHQVWETDGREPRCMDPATGVPSGSPRPGVLSGSLRVSTARGLAGGWPPGGGVTEEEEQGPEPPQCLGHVRSPWTWCWRRFALNSGAIQRLLGFCITSTKDNIYTLIHCIFKLFRGHLEYSSFAWTWGNAKTKHSKGKHLFQEMFLFHGQFKQEYPQVSGKVNQLVKTEVVRK